MLNGFNGLAGVRDVIQHDVWVRKFLNFILIDGRYEGRVKKQTEAANIM